ncbi:hypothetical protein D9M72_626210 [compost metagenome]
MLGDGFEADPGVGEVLTRPRQVGGVLVPGRTPGPAALLEKQLLREVPDMFGAPEVGEQLAEWERGDQLIQPSFCERIGVIDV